MILRKQLNPVLLSVLSLVAMLTHAGLRLVLGRGDGTDFVSGLFFGIGLGLLGLAAWSGWRERRA